MFNPKHLDGDPDKVSVDGKNLYTIGYWEIFWRNLVAGIGRGLGSFLFSIIIIALLMNIFFMYMWPVLEPFLSTFGNLSQIINQLGSAYKPGTSLPNR